ncbi:MAG: class I SAM-dependent methyltransferase [Vicinamibacterales bacterium]
MGVASHLGIQLDDYDETIRTFIPHYEDMLDAAAAAVSALTKRAPRIVDLGTGSGALAGRVLRACPGARITGIDNDQGMLALARRRMSGRLTAIGGDFTSTAFPRCDAMTASFSLHHIATPRAKAAIYAKSFAALTKGGALVNADCCVSSNTSLRARGFELWHQHLARTYGMAGARRHLRAWAKEDFYFTLEQERALLARAGFRVDVVWRRDSFAVIAGLKH